MRGSRLLPLLSVAALACVGEPVERAVPAAAESTAVTGRFPELPDSLVLTAPEGRSVWFSGARASTDSLGTPCVERGLVIVTGGQRKLVPLLMTGVAPTLVNDSTIRARIWLNCRPGNTYDVNLRTGTPTRIR